MATLSDPSGVQSPGVASLPPPVAPSILYAPSGIQTGRPASVPAPTSPGAVGPGTVLTGTYTLQVGEALAAGTYAAVAIPGVALAGGGSVALGGDSSDLAVSAGGVLTAHFTLPSYIATPQGPLTATFTFLLAGGTSRTSAQTFSVGAPDRRYYRLGTLRLYALLDVFDGQR